MSLTLGKMARIWNSNSLFYHRNTKECELKTDSVTQWNFQNSEKQSMVYSNQMNAQSGKQWLKTWEEGFVTFELSLVLPSSPAWGWFWRWGPIFQVWSPDFGKSRVGLVPKKLCFSVLTLRSFPEGLEQDFAFVSLYLELSQDRKVAKHRAFLKNTER